MLSVLCCAVPCCAVLCCAVHGQDVVKACLVILSWSRGLSWLDEILAPSNQDRVLVTKSLNCWYEVPGTMHKLGTTYSVPSSPYQVSGSQYLVPGAWSQVLEARLLDT